jgi:hypothetical protein
MSSVIIPTWRTCLDSIYDFPAHSSTFAAIHLSSISHRLNQIAEAHLGRNIPQNKDPVAVFGRVPNYSTEAVFKSVISGVITYFALTTLSYLSLVINGVVGIGKVGLALLIGASTQQGTSKYRDAQNLLEQGVFHVASGVADFAIGHFRLAAAALSLAYGFAPQKVQELVGKALIWKGAILRADNAEQAEVERDRANYSYLQIFADIVQRFILPDVGAGRWQAFMQVRNLEPSVQPVTPAV